MFEYTFVKIEPKFFGTKPKEDYREIIKEYAENGWRFVQIFAPSMNDHGAPGYYELFFEKKIQ